MTEWISIKDRLPNREHILLLLKNRRYPDKYAYDVGYFITTHDRQYFRYHLDYRDDLNITHWQPLPAPPEK